MTERNNAEPVSSRIRVKPSSMERISPAEFAVAVGAQEVTVLKDGDSGIAAYLHARASRHNRRSE